MRLPSAVAASILAISWICSPAAAQSEPAPQDRERLVRRFIDAFNAQDAEAMARLVTEDVQWLSVDGTSIAVETGTKQELLVSMGKYFKSCPSCRSSLSGVIATSNRLSAIEVASWDSANGKREQRGVSVYEFSGPLISRVYYFPAERQEAPDFARIFAGRDGCFTLYDLKARKLLVRSDDGRCALRTSPCSTFKVPLALMAFDAGILTDASSPMKWDGTKTSREAWNRDQTAATWMQHSVVWFSQRLTPLLGMDKVKAYLAAFDFGNEDMTGGLTKAWLESSLLISPDEELRFWERFWREELPVSKLAFAMTKKITFVDTSEAGWTLHGKTGSGAAGPAGPGDDPVLWLGWFVGHVSRGDREYLFVCSYTDRVPSSDDRPAGWIAREIAKQILAKLGVY